MSDFAVIVLAFVSIAVCYGLVWLFSQLSQILEHESVAQVVARAKPRYVKRRDRQTDARIDTGPDTNAPGPAIEPPAITSIQASSDDQGNDIMLPVSTKMPDREMIILLATQRTADNKHRWSANDVAKFVGGTREDVLAIIRSVRGEAKQAEQKPPSQYRPLNDRLQPYKEVK